mgnify:CR=1 FL=1
MALLNQADGRLALAKGKSVTFRNNFFISLLCLFEVHGRRIFEIEVLCLGLLFPPHKVEEPNGKIRANILHRITHHKIRFHEIS